MYPSPGKTKISLKSKGIPRSNMGNVPLGPVESLAAWLYDPKQRRE